MMRPLLFALVLLPAAAAANEFHVPSGADGAIEFNMPSGNVGCRYIPAGGTSVYATATGRAELICTRMEPSLVTVILDGLNTRPAPIRNSGEVGGLSIAPVLPYGRFWQAGPFTCLSALNGLTCINGAGGGMSLARGGVTTW